MKAIKIYSALLFILLTHLSLAIAQETTINYDSILVKSYIDNKQDKFDFYYSVVRYQSFADVIILPVQSDRNSDNLEIQLSENVSSSVSRNVSIDNAGSIRVPNLEKDKEYYVRVYKRNQAGGQTLIDSETKIINTGQSQEFRASATFYRSLGEWSSKENQSQKLIDFLRSNLNRFNPHEVAAFIQFHYKLEEIEDNNNSQIASFINNVDVHPSDTSSGTNSRASCNCSLVLNTRRFAQPNYAAYSGPPEETNYLALGDGAAKNMVLSMVGKHGSGKYEANIGGALSPLYAIISYNLVCSDNISDLPEECKCPKKILYDYSYTARLRTNVNIGGGLWIWSKGGEAAAEDHALLSIRNGASVSAIDAGKVRISTNCQSNWNTTWWTQAANILVSASGVAIDTNATVASWAALLPQVVNLFATNFFNSGGDCTNKDEINTLMAGSGELTMTTNNPVSILISSLSYEFVRGYGKWESRSSIVSDYHISAVLLGQDVNRPECCTPNVADFLVGYFEDTYVTVPPWNIKVKVLDGSVNSAANLKGKVNGLFTLWGPWPGLVRDAMGNYILDGDFGHIVRTFKDCAPIDPIQGGDAENRLIRKHGDFALFPNPVIDEINIVQDWLMKITLYDSQGKTIMQQNVNENTNSHTIKVSLLPSGQYYLIATDNQGQSWYNHFQKI
jgi:hypothetical protein